jgi:hypothetical protein
MTKQFSGIKKLTVSEIIDKNNRLIEALKNLNDKLSCEDRIGLGNQKEKSGSFRSESETDLL